MNLQDMTYEDLSILRQQLVLELAVRRRRHRAAAEMLNLRRDLPGIPDGARAIIGEIADEHQVAISDLMGVRSTQKLSLARWVIWSRLRDRGYSSPQIGRIFNRDHTTVVHGWQRLAKLQAPRLEAAE